MADRVGYPVLVRPTFVLGGRGMQLVHTETDLRHYVRDAIEASPGAAAAHPILVDHFLEDATEVDVDCISDGETVVIGAIMEHIEEAGIHSGDSACVIPPFSLSEEVKAEITAATKAMARELNVIGLMNVQFAVKDDASTCSKSILAPAAPRRLSARPSACRCRSSPPRSWPARRWRNSASPRRSSPRTSA